jgi:DNA-binding transcriptional regulator YhcF (GntR family)
MSLLDPDDPRPPYQQVANSLRAAILTRRFEPGEKLPSQAELATRYGVARMTIQQALRILRDEGLIVSRQGSGVFARERTERPVGLRPHVEVAFQVEDVRIDFCGYTAETLNGAIQEPLDKIRAGRLTPSSVRLRLLLSDLSGPLALPSPVDNDPKDDADVRARMSRLFERHALGIRESINELRELELVRSASVEIRTHKSAPLFKLYLLNRRDLFFGFYPIVQHPVKIGRREVLIHDPMGKDAVLFQHTADVDPESSASLQVTEAAKWFDNIWTTIGRPYEHD